MSRFSNDNKIVVRGLPSGTQQRDIEAYFNRIGRINDIWTKDSGDDVFGFVGFENKADFDEALTHNGKTLNGAPMLIEPKGAPRGGAPRGYGRARGVSVGEKKVVGEEAHMCRRWRSSADD
jgi:hypothetical protein